MAPMVTEDRCYFVWLKKSVRLVFIDSARFKLLAMRRVVVDGCMWVSCKLTSALFK